jgi:hypothetical protein
MECEILTPTMRLCAHPYLIQVSLGLLPVGGLPPLPSSAYPAGPSQARGTCLHYASLSGFPDLVNFLMTEFSPDFNARGFFDDVTALHPASRDGHVKLGQLHLGNLELDKRHVRRM